jgi:hypothetical protein
MLGLPACVSHPGPHFGPVRDYIFQKCELKLAGASADVHDRQKAGTHHVKKKVDETVEK